MYKPAPNEIMARRKKAANMTLRLNAITLEAGPYSTRRSITLRITRRPKPLGNLTTGVSAVACMRLLCRSAYLPPLAPAKRSLNNRRRKPAAPALREYLSSSATPNGAKAARIFVGTRSGGITPGITRPLLPLSLRDSLIAGRVHAVVRRGRPAASRSPRNPYRPNRLTRIV